MSNYSYPQGNKSVTYGYDKKLDYVFVVIFDNDEMVYSNINDKNINFSNEIDFTHFDKVLEEFNVILPESEKIKVIKERLEYLDTIDDIPFRIKARYSNDLVGAPGSKKQFGIEVGQRIGDSDCFDNIEHYEFFESKLEAYTRVNQINGAFIDDWQDI